MHKHFLTTAFAASFLLTGATSAKANDLVDFLRAVRGVSQTRTTARGHAHESHGHARHSTVIHDRGHAHGVHGRSSYDLSTRAIAKRQAEWNRQATRSAYRVYGSSPSIRISSGLSANRRLRDNSLLYGGSYRPAANYRQDVYPPVYDVPGTPVPNAPIVIPQDQNFTSPNLSGPLYGPAPVISPAVPSIAHMPHRFGEIVDCAVPLYPRVHIEDPENIAPHAVPVVVAVRDPNLCDHKCDCCAPRCVYVEVCVPNCPPRSIRVSSCGTKLKMDFGKYEVEIKSRKGCIEIDYDD